jgi:hypothetical protein
MANSRNVHIFDLLLFRHGHDEHHLCSKTSQGLLFDFILD